MNLTFQQQLILEALINRIQLASKEEHKEAPAVDPITTATAAFAMVCEDNETAINTFTNAMAFSLIGKENYARLAQENQELKAQLEELTAPVNAQGGGDE